MDRYQDFLEITEATLRSSVAQLNIEATAKHLDCFMRAYLKPPAFRTRFPHLQRLERQRMAILSNGSPGMLESAIRHNALEPYFTAVISVDKVKTYKPSPRVYALGPEILGAPPRRYCLFLPISGTWLERRPSGIRSAGATGLPRRWTHWALIPISRSQAWSTWGTRSRLTRLPDGPRVCQCRASRSSRA
jgi:hypothetical protein